MVGENQGEVVNKMSKWIVSKFINLDGCFVRLDEVSAFERKLREDEWGNVLEGRWLIEISLRGVESSYEIDDDSGELFAKLQRALEAT